MNRTTISIEHVVYPSNRSYQQIIDALESRLGTQASRDAVAELLRSPTISWEQITQVIAEGIGSSGFVIFSKIEHSEYLAFLGGKNRAVQYAIGNALFAKSLTLPAPETALYAPLRLVVYEEEGKTFVAYDSPTSFLAQYRDEGILQAAQGVEKKLEALVLASISD